MFSRWRTQRLRFVSVVLLVITVGLAATPLAPTSRAASRLQEASTVVERWRGRVNVQGTLDATIVSLGTIPGLLRQTYTLDFDLKVYEDGFLHGDVTATFRSLSFEQISPTCGFVLKCRVAIALNSPVARTFVEGQRYPATNNQAEFVLRKEVEISSASYTLQTSLGSNSQTTTEQLYADVLPASPFKIQLHPYGRPPTAEPKNTRSRAN
jgi:hypothetical protein